MHERELSEAESAARLLDALLSRTNVAEAVRGCFYGNPLFCIAIFTAVVRTRFTPDSDAREVSGLVAGIASDRSGFPAREAEVFIRLTLGDLTAASEIDPLALAYGEIIIAVLTAIFTGWQPGRSEIEAVFEEAAAIVPALAELPYVQRYAEDWYALGMPTSPFSSLATTEEPVAAEAVTRRGVDLLDAGQTEEAIEEFSRALQLDAQYLWAMTSRARAYGILGRHEHAVLEFSRALEIHPANASALVGRGSAYGDLGRFDEAFDDFARAIEVDERWAASARLSRGIVYADLGRYADAIDEYDIAFNGYSDPATLLYHRCMAYYQLDNFDQALADISRAIQLDPKAHYFSFRGEVLRMLDRPLEALADFDRGTEPDLDNIWIFTSRVSVLQELDRWDEALTECDQAIVRWPDRTEPYLTRGSAYLELDRRAEAQADFRRAVNLEPDLAESISQLLDHADEKNDS